MVINNKTEYEKKMTELCYEIPTPMLAGPGPHPTVQKMSPKIIERMGEKQIRKETKDHIYPTSQDVPKIYGTPKIHQKKCPLRPTVTSLGSITYKAACLITDILGPQGFGNQRPHENQPTLCGENTRLRSAPGTEINNI